MRMKPVNVAGDDSKTIYIQQCRRCNAEISRREVGKTDKPLRTATYTQATDLCSWCQCLFIGKVRLSG